MKRLLYVGDAGCPSGFAKATHNILETLHRHYDVTVLGINYRGDGWIVNGQPDASGYPEFLRGRIWACHPGGDYIGVGRLVWMCDKVQPDVIVIQNDGWNIPPYIHTLRRCKDYDDVPVVAAVAVDGKNFQGGWLDGVSSAVFWTEFARSEARGGGYTGPADVIPLGVDMTTYRPMDRREARQARGLPEALNDAFIVGNVNRNQPRKRWDLLIKYFAEWSLSRHIDDAWLFLHTAPTGDTGVDVKQLARYYGVLDRLLLVEPPVWYGVSEQEMAMTYNCFDVQATTTQGEGMGLTTMEGMACGVPAIVPDWSALGEVCRDAVRLIPCTSTVVGPPYVNVIGGVADEAQFIEALDALYTAKEVRADLSRRGLARMSEPLFRWESIGEAWTEVLERTLQSGVRKIA
jgi:glycosyltransferase involved in cell wall biosynthesis